MGCQAGYRAKFESTYKSFGVESQVSRAKKLTDDYRVDGVPKFIINFPTKEHWRGASKISLTYSFADVRTRPSPPAFFTTVRSLFRT